MSKNQDPCWAIYFWFACLWVVGAVTAPMFGGHPFGMTFGDGHMGMGYHWGHMQPTPHNLRQPH